MVSDVTITSALTQQQRTQASEEGLATDFADFLNLLTVQLQNQDPLSPMDTTEFTNQLVAFTGVEQQINTNQKLDDLVALNLSNTIGSAIGYIGKTASYVSSEFYFDGNEAGKISYAYNGNPIEAKLRVLDENGDTVYEADAQTSGGTHEFEWDGRDNNGNLVGEGTYQVRIDALDIEGNAVEATAVVEGRVRGIETQDGAIFLLVGDRAVSVGNVLNIYETEEEDTPAGDDGGTDTTSDGTTPDDGTTGA